MSHHIGVSDAGPLTFGRGSGFCPEKMSETSEQEHMSDAPEHAEAKAAPQSAPKTAPKAPEKQEQGESWLELGKTLLYALGIALIIRTFLFQPFNIPSGSMEGTLLIGDYLFVEKFSYGYSRYSFPLGLGPFSGRIFASPPHRGDVIVFKMPNKTSPDYLKDYIKRVIGMPGDRVQMINGVLWLNGHAVPKVRVQDYIEYDEAGLEHRVAQYRETLPGGKSYLVLDRYPDGSEDNTQLFVVPAGNYFMMGDNRDDSDDSRLDVGYVPSENLEGKALFRFFSTDGYFWEFWKWRFDRMFTAID